MSLSHTRETYSKFSMPELIYKLYLSIISLLTYYKLISKLVLIYNKYNNNNYL